MSYSQPTTKANFDVRDILALSDGTLATLSGLTSVEQLEGLVGEWVAFEMAHPSPANATWVSSWNAFKAGRESA